MGSGTSRLLSLCQQQSGIGGDDNSTDLRNNDNDVTFLYTGQAKWEILPRDVLTRVRVVDPCVKYIYTWAFMDCKLLVEVDLCSGIEQIGEASFRGCCSLRRINIPSTVREICSNAFRDCKLLESIEIGEGVPKISNSSFRGCESLKRINIPFTVKEICRDAFRDCKLLERIEIGEGVERIGSFRGCESLKCFKIPSNAKEICSDAFRDCKLLESIEIGEGVHKIGCSAFKGCKYLKCIKIPPTVQVISDDAFSDCIQLAQVELSEGLVRLGESSFRRCCSLKRIKIPSTVREICSNAFRECKLLESIEIGKGVQQISNSAFKGCESLYYIKIPFTVKVIDGHAFSDCIQLAEVELSEGLEIIRHEAFRNCTSLRNIQLPDTLKLIGKRAFSNCHQLITAEIADRIAIVDALAFEDCSSLQNVAIPPASLAVGSFEGCTGLLILFGSEQIVQNALKHGFAGLSIHELYYPPRSVVKRVDPIPDGRGIGVSPKFPDPFIQDCLGMTPLHMLACSTKNNLDQNLAVFQYVATNQPKSLITDDNWGCPPILYAIWGNASEDTVQFLIESQKAAFSSMNINWDRMIRTLCRNGASVGVAKRLIDTQKNYDSDNDFDWQKVALEMTIGCLVRCGSFREQLLHWNALIQAITSSLAYQELAQHLLGIQQNFFQDTNSIDWQLVCEELVAPLKGWWKVEKPFRSLHGGYPAYCDPGQCLETFRFLVKYNIAERCNEIGERNWQIDIRNMVALMPSASNHYGNTIRANHFANIHSQLVAYEHLREAPFLLELALWKSKIITSMPAHSGVDLGKVCDMKEFAADMKSQYRVSSGAEVVIPNVLSFLYSK